MDTVKMGKFLKELRKEQGMTQEALGERIGVTNKTVSRWETGDYVPPVESLMLLSDIYGVTINEIVAGQRLSEQDYAEIADDNLTDVLKGNEKHNRKFERCMMLLRISAAVICAAIIMLLPDGETTWERVRTMVIIVLATVGFALITNTLTIVAQVLYNEKIKKHP